MAKWGDNKLDQIKKHSYSGDSSFLDFVIVETGMPQKLRLVGEPIILSCHWVTLNTTEGNSFKVPFNCSKWVPSECEYETERLCPLCAGGESKGNFGDDFLNKHCTYENGEWEPGLSAYSIVIVRATQKKGEVPFGKFRIPIGVFSKIETFAQDADWGNPADSETGYDITFMKTKGQKGGWDKWNDPIMARKNSPLSEDEAQWVAYKDDFEFEYRYLDAEKLTEEMRKIIDRDSESTSFPGDDKGDDEDKPVQTQKPAVRQTPDEKAASETDILSQIASNIAE